MKKIIPAICFVITLTKGDVTEAENQDQEQEDSDEKLYELINSVQLLNDYQVYMEEIIYPLTVNQFWDAFIADEPGFSYDKAMEGMDGDVL